MPLLVQKYGGSSLANSDQILRAAHRAIAAQRQGSQVVVVVSAVGDTTDDLIAMARQISERPSARELDQLLATGEQVSIALMAIAIESLGVPAVSFTAAQISILTDSLHTRARIREISTERIFQALGEGRIVIVAGFQGVNRNAEMTTLGRGGSDTTAVALATVLGADACEVYTDVDGVSTADPRIVPEARKIDRISRWSIPARSRSTWSPVFSKGVPVWKVSRTHSFYPIGPRRESAAWFVPLGLACGPFLSRLKRALFFPRQQSWHRRVRCSRDAPSRW